MKLPRIVRSVVLANTAEAFKRIVESTNDYDKQSKIVQNEHYLSNRAFFYESDSKIVITPHAIDQTVMKRNCSLLSYSNVANVPLNTNEVSLSKALLQNTGAMKALVGALRRNPGTEISSYAVTDELLELIAHLRLLKLEFQVKGVPKNGWTTRYLDSKVGFRREIGHLQKKHHVIRIPKGTICSEPVSALETARSLLEADQSFVMKAEYGESGWGILMVHTKAITDKEERLKAIIKELKDDEVWKHDRIIVEQMIESDTSIKSPSSEMYIDEATVRTTYLCQQEVDMKGRFHGISMGKECLDENVMRKLVKISKIVGERYRHLGYRGFFDLDFILDREAIPYLVESNMRRTGGTHVFDLAQSLLGSGWQRRHYLISDDSYLYSDTCVSASELFEALEPLLFPIHRSKKGIVLTNYSNSAPCLGYVAFGDCKEECLDLVAEFGRILSNCLSS